MKRSIKFLLGWALLGVFFTACEDDPILPTLSDDPTTFIAPSIENTDAGALVELTFDNTDNVFEVFNWIASDYGVNLPTKYTIEVDVDNTFTSPYILAADLSETTFSASVNQINTAILSLGLEPFETVDISIRVISNVVGGGDIAPLMSEAITRTVSGFVTEFASIYMIGDALLGWDLAKAVETYGTGPSQYSVIAEFNNGGAFRFFAEADWDATSYNWTFFEGGSVDAAFESAADGDVNIRFTGATGYYRISLNLKDKTITMEALAGQPELYMVGNAVPAAGWDWATPVQFTWIQDGIFEATTDFISDEGTAFRLFTINGDWGSGLNYPYYNDLEYEIDSQFEDALDGDNNFKFNGTSGTFKIVVNEIAKTITLAEAGTVGPPKYLVGDGTQAGWDWATPVELIQIEAGVYEGTTTLNTAGAFRIFATNGDWDSGTNYPTYISDGYTIDTNFEDALDGDNNFKFNGVDANYVFTLNDNDKTISIKEVSVGNPLYLLGSAVPAAGWAWTSPVEMVQYAAGVYRASTEFVPFNPDQAFRVFSTLDDWDSGINYPGYADNGYTIDADFENANDGDQNFKFVGTGGTFLMTIDTNTKTITLD